jgi:ketosteroid isomerase-like protein
VILRAVSDAHVELTRRAFQAFNDRDIDVFLEVMAEDVQASPILAGVEGGYRGHEGMRRWWSALADAFPDIVAEIEEIEDKGDRTVTRTRLHGHGAESSTPFDTVVRHEADWRDGKCVAWRIGPV